MALKLKRLANREGRSDQTADSTKIKSSTMIVGSFLVFPSGDSFRLYRSEPEMKQRERENHRPIGCWEERRNDKGKKEWQESKTSLTEFRHQMRSDDLLAYSSQSQSCPSSDIVSCS